MVIATPTTQSTCRSAPVLRYGAAVSCYRLYGLLVRSDILLPAPPLSDLRAASPDLVVRLRRGETAVPDGVLVGAQHCPCERHHGAAVSLVYQGQAGTWMRFVDIGTFFLDSNGRDVAVYPEEGVEERVLGLAFAGQVCTAVLYARDYPSLHASAIVSEGGAVAFLGASGRGKSTLAAGFVQAGATLLSDDILAVDLHPDGGYGLPSLPIMKLGPLAVDQTLHLTQDLPAVMPGQEKKLLQLGWRYGFAQRRARLRAMYVVERYDPFQRSNVDIAIRRLGTRQGFMALLENLAGAHLVATPITRFLPRLARLAAVVPVSVLKFPNGFEYQEAVRATVHRDLERQ